ncbi:hypothetical protein SOPP22_04375 [Shewanella sp. OPT22]|nr:hypothetical protein SOPP22_04375 [Shewanella sp. OPT22]
MKQSIEAMLKLLNLHHPYDVPERIMLSIHQSSGAYLNWIKPRLSYEKIIKYIAYQLSFTSAACS